MVNFSIGFGGAVDRHRRVPGNHQCGVESQRMAKLRQTQQSNTATAPSAHGVVYCQNDAAALLLGQKKLSWPVVGCSEKFPERIETPAVIVGDDCITLPRNAIAALGSDRARLIYLSDVPKNSIEEESGYRFKSMLAVPMKNPRRSPRGIAADQLQT